MRHLSLTHRISSTAQRAALCGVLLVGLVGCNLGMPRFFQPGHKNEQALRATFHDPYGDPSLGQDISGARPIDYRVPRPTPVKNQWFFDR